MLQLRDEYHTASAEDTLSSLQSNATTGLSKEEVARRHTEFGFNILPAEKPRSFLTRLWEQLYSMVILVLVIGAALSLGFHHYADGIVIFCVTIINVATGLFMEGNAENASKRLKNMMSPIAVVVRDEERMQIDTSELTIGDIFLLQPGDSVPADGRIINSVDLHVLESALTGESHTVFKHSIPVISKATSLAERTCLVFAGTQVIKGTATCVVVQIGAQCEIGKISGLLQDVTVVKTPLVLQLEKLGLYLSITILCIAAISLGIAIYRGYEIDEAFNIAVGIAVAAIPEGLPACVTITFAVGVNSMADKRAVVKTLPAVETLGSVNVICSDKTGTLTQNKMTVKAMYTTDSLLEFSDNGYVENKTFCDDATSAVTKGIFDRISGTNEGKDLLMATLLPAVFCNDSHVAIVVDREQRDSISTALQSRPAPVRRRSSFNMPMTIEENEDNITLRGDLQSTIDLGKQIDYKVEGDPTENCLLTLSIQQTTSATQVKRWTKHYPRIAEVPFDSAHKYMATFHNFQDVTDDTDPLLRRAVQKLKDHYCRQFKPQQPLQEDVNSLSNVIFVKGAPEKILSFTSPSSRNGVTTDEWMARAASLASRGMRVLAVGYKLLRDSSSSCPSQLGESTTVASENEVQKEDEKEASLATARINEELLSETSPPHDFVMLGLFGILDPPRPDAIVAVQQAQQAGITVKMITGDHPVTAWAIAATLGLVPPSDTHDNQPSVSQSLVKTAPVFSTATTGTELDRMSDEEFDQVVMHQNVFARTTPEHKLRIVTSLQRQRCVCSMTGDGVNDAPALKAANIGVAMGIAGTEVAKDAANMILVDDNFSTMVDAIRVGRATYSNMVKMLVFVLAADGGQAFSLILSLIIGWDMPIEALQILWVNMVTSISLGTVLAFEPPHDEVMTVSPRPPNKRIFGYFLTWRLVFVSLVFVAAVLGNFQWEKERFSHTSSGVSLKYLRTVAVNTLVSCRVGYLFSCRFLRTLTWNSSLFTGNMVIYRGIVLSAALQVLFTYAPPLQYVFRTEALDGVSWGKILLMCVGTFVVVELEKCIGLYYQPVHDTRQAWKQLRQRHLQRKQQPHAHHTVKADPNHPQDLAMLENGYSRVAMTSEEKEATYLPTPPVVDSIDSSDDDVIRVRKSSKSKDSSVLTEGLASQNLRDIGDIELQLTAVETDK